MIYSFLSNYILFISLHFEFFPFFHHAALRGGICQCSHRYFKANNKYMDSFNEEEKSKYLMYFDVNGLYGSTMCESLPISDFEWVNDISLDSILKTSDDAEYGYFLEVDLDYPSSLHNAHNDYPLCPEKMRIGNSKVDKLVLNLNAKKKYVLHYRTLKFILSHGMSLTRVHKVLRFKQKKWLKPFISLNHSHRLNCKNQFEKNLYKLMNNSIYGKTLENVKNRCDIRLVNSWAGRYGAQSLISRPNFKGTKIFNENLIAVELNKTNVKIDKPGIIGVAILELSKNLMYKFHYDFMHANYKYKKCRLGYTDTDSFIYCIEDDDAYKLIDRNPLQFNKYKLGCMKDENDGFIMTEFVGLRPKMYSYKVISKKNKNEIVENKRAKGVKRHIINNKLKFKDFLECVKHNTVVSGRQPLIKSHYHKVYSIKQKKIFLDSGDDKRFILDDKISTLAWGHYKLSQ